MNQLLRPEGGREVQRLSSLQIGGRAPTNLEDICTGSWRQTDGLLYLRKNCSFPAPLLRLHLGGIGEKERHFMIPDYGPHNARMNWQPGRGTTRLIAVYGLFVAHIYPCDGGLTRRGRPLSPTNGR